MKKYDLNQALKEKAAKEALNNSANSNGEIKLDDVSRVKVLSPGRKVFKRFIRNRLAVVGSVILIVMFAFAFIGPLFYPYGQKEVFHKHDVFNDNYAQAQVNTSFTGMTVDESVSIPNKIKNMMNTNIAVMDELGVDEYYMVLDGNKETDKFDGNIYIFNRSGEHLCLLSKAKTEKLIDSAGVDDISVGNVMKAGGVKFNDNAKKYLFDAGVDESALSAAVLEAYNSKTSEIEFNGIIIKIDPQDKMSYSITAVLEHISYVQGVAAKGEDFESALESAIEDGELRFEHDGTSYALVKNGGAGKQDSASYSVFSFAAPADAMIFTRYAFDRYNVENEVSDDVRTSALYTAATGKDSFTVGDATYRVDYRLKGVASAEGETAEDGEYIIVYGSDGVEVGEFNVLSIKRYSGQDTIEYEMKQFISGIIADMESKHLYESSFVYEIPAQNEDGMIAYDEEGNVIKSEAHFTVTKTNTGAFVFKCDQIKYLIDRFASPTWEHVLGTDGDGFDVLARIMSGGRVSLMVGFVVIIIESILGIIMGGLAGYYGKWVDMIIMRLVDIFYCIPSLPILIIIGVMMDAQGLTPYVRLIV
ncbi:MAG: hypothetical protein J5940_05435, partial [Clostridia bacterium]|nr:hypothetical protein [Clostridia bacterium]